MTPFASVLALGAILAIFGRCHALVVYPLHLQNVRAHHQFLTKTTTLGCRKQPPLFSSTSAATIVEKDDATTTTPTNFKKSSSNKSSNVKLIKNDLGSAFAQKLFELGEYQRENGHCLVPKRYESNPSLGNWVNKQRQNYRKYLKGEKSSMNEERISALNKMGFIWNASSTPVSTSNDMKWQQMYDQLSQFHSTNGDCRVPSSSQLGQWVVRQRFLYRQYPSAYPSAKVKSSLTVERIKLLNELNFPWNTRSEQLWEQRINDLREFKEQNDHCMVPRTYPHNPQLSAWVATQRKNYQRRQAGKTVPLTVERIKELEDMGFVWSFWDHNCMW